MRSRLVILLLLSVVSGFSRTLISRTADTTQQTLANPNTQGATVFAKLCASCHGEDGAGARASALRDNRRLGAMSASEIENIIRGGTPNGMPPFASLSPAELESVTTYVRSLNASIAEVTMAGDVAAGERFFFGTGKCATCHIARGAGNAVGPDLSIIGRQLTADELRTALTQPDATIARGYAVARVQLKDGRTLRGFVRNEGNHVLPLQTLDGRLIAIDKRSATITRETGSAMPALKAAGDEIRDVIAYLSSLRGNSGLASGGAMGAHWFQRLR